MQHSNVPITIPKLIAHRGASSCAPENTLVAMRKAKALGATWVEFDVTLTADNIPICLHDATLNRTTNGTGFITHTLFHELRKLDAGSWFAPEFVNEPIPSFEEIITCINECGMHMNIEIKPTEGLGVETAEHVLQIIDRCWQTEWPQPLLTSFDPTVIARVCELKPHALTGLLLNEWTPDWQKLADEINAVTVHLSKRIVNAQYVEDIHATNRKVLVYTVNHYSEAQDLFAMGVDGIFSDYADLLETKTPA